MTPTDALIEKMARAVYTRSMFGRYYLDEDVAGAWERASPYVRNLNRQFARAAYEAEHAAIDDEALDRGINAITENRVRAEAEHEEDGK